MMKVKLIALCSILATSFAWGQTHPARFKMNKDMIAFFSGTWDGHGRFANGISINAQASFELSLDSCWIVYKHQDVSPNKYKSIAIWGMDQQNGMLKADIFDNFYGHRQFSGANWEGDSLRLKYTNMPSTSAAQRFTFTKQSGKSFLISYETSLDDINWRKVDVLLFTKRNEH